VASREDVSGEVLVNCVQGQESNDLSAVACGGRADGRDSSTPTCDYNCLPMLSLVQQRSERTARLGSGHGTHNIRLSDLTRIRG